MKYQISFKPSVYENISHAESGGNFGHLELWPLDLLIIFSRLKGIIPSSYIQNIYGGKELKTNIITLKKGQDIPEGVKKAVEKYIDFKLVPD